MAALRRSDVTLVQRDAWPEGLFSLREGTIMRPLSLLLPASLLLLASSAGAQNMPYPPSEAASMSTVQVTARPKATWVREEEAQQIRGAYSMSNGWRMDVRAAARHIDATIDRQKPIRLIAVAPYKFVSRDGNVTMEFNRGEWGEDMMMSYVPDPRLAQVVVISSVPLAQR
jgi:hypothetical protein